ncbi:hypothetical protein EPA93_21115 [Ktedonosporobacter rubrisoli]|uniref:Sucrase ferredoxin n=1 Tax=Ktedonosporobacter rubrisoli TaxID=2509675 RepID=A0A4P6JSV6_KTERU|nr:sucrase ferredoxin [Ktedonosporobacter rubrisoli]QBD78363.1 hypothetical protein EPA93_21115 [Ktedonosporobacter rubrisoli]
MRERQFCAQVSRDAREPFIGTAPRVDCWLLLEYTGAWAPYEIMIEQSSLSTQVKEWILHAGIALPHFRLQFIRQHTRPLQTINCFVAISREDRQALYKFSLSSYEDLLELNLAAILQGHPTYSQYICDEPLFLVCTHGKQDQCCAKFGMPIYTELAQQVADFTWHTSHVGGDKFAANIVCLPYGIYYSRVLRSEVEAIIASFRQGEIYIRKYRGRTSYPPTGQAADYFLRRITHIYDLQAFRLLAIDYETDDIARISFIDLANNIIHHIYVSIALREVVSYSTCKGRVESATYHYQLHKHDMLEPIIAGNTTR